MANTFTAPLTDLQRQLLAGTALPLRRLTFQPYDYQSSHVLSDQPVLRAQQVLVSAPHHSAVARHMSCITL